MEARVLRRGVILIMVAAEGHGRMELTPSGIRKVAAERKALREAKAKLLAETPGGEGD